jgi:hypothetical protein
MRPLREGGGPLVARGATLRGLLLLSTWMVLVAACPKQKPPEPKGPAAARHDVDSDDPADPRGICPPGSVPAQNEYDGCPDVDAGSPSRRSRDASAAR